MIMAPDKKKSVTLIMDRLKGPAAEKPQSEDGGELDNSIGIDSAAEEIMQAIDKKDAKGLVSALKSFMEMCDEEMPEEKAEEVAEKPEAP